MIPLLAGCLTTWLVLYTSHFIEGFFNVVKAILDDFYYVLVFFAEIFLVICNKFALFKSCSAAVYGFAVYGFNCAAKPVIKLTLQLGLGFLFLG